MSDYPRLVVKEGPYYLIRKSWVWISAADTKHILFGYICCRIIEKGQRHSPFWKGCLMQLNRLLFCNVVECWTHWSEKPHIMDTMVSCKYLHKQKHDRRWRNGQIAFDTDHIIRIFLLLIFFPFESHSLNTCQQQNVFLRKQSMTFL